MVPDEVIPVAAVIAPPDEIFKFPLTLKASSVFKVFAALLYRLVSLEEPKAIPFAASVLSAPDESHSTCVSAPAIVKP